LHDVLPMWCTRLSWWNGTVRGVASMSSNLPPWNISTGLTIVGFTPPVVTAPRPSTRPSTTISTTSQSPKQGRNDPSLQDHRGGSLSGLDVMVWRWRLPRHPEVFVRELSMAEGQRLQKITRTARDPIRLRRATVVLMSAQGQAVGDIVDLLHVDEGYVRDVIHAFNQRGFDALDPKWSGGRPAAVDATTRQQI